MVEKAAYDYAEYFKKTDISKEINPICISIEDMLARLEEFESLLATVKFDTNMTVQNNIPQILAFREHFDTLCKRIDNLEQFVNMVDKNLSTLEQIVTVSEQELAIPDHSLKGLLKPLFGSKSKTPTATNLKDGQFIQPHIFNSSDYFTPENQ